MTVHHHTWSHSWSIAVCIQILLIIALFLVIQQLEKEENGERCKNNRARSQDIGLQYSVDLMQVPKLLISCCFRWTKWKRERGRGKCITNSYNITCPLTTLTFFSLSHYFREWTLTCSWRDQELNCEKMCIFPSCYRSYWRGGWKDVYNNKNVGVRWKKEEKKDDDDSFLFYEHFTLIIWSWGDEVSSCLLITILELSSKYRYTLYKGITIGRRSKEERREEFYDEKLYLSLQE